MVNVTAGPRDGPSSPAWCLERAVQDSRRPSWGCAAITVVVVIVVDFITSIDVTSTSLLVKNIYYIKNICYKNILSYYIIIIIIIVIIINIINNYYNKNNNNNNI